MMQFAN